MANERLRELNAYKDEDIVLDMSPMIDMVFLLLIFFIVVSTPMVVRVDPSVKPAVAFNSEKPDDTNVRIVVNVRGEGDYRKSAYKDEEGGKMQTEDEIALYIEQEAKRIKGMNSDYKPTIHLRGDKEVLFEHSQTVIAAAARAGINEIIFSVYPFAK